MKSQIDIYNERKTIHRKRKELVKQIQIVDNELVNLQTECSHKLVLAFEDHKPHKIGRIIDCICPSCGKEEKIFPSHEIEKSSFKDSKLIDLTKYPIYVFKDYYLMILEHIFKNYDLFYSDDISEKEISESILDIVEIDEKKDNQSKIKKYIINK